MQNITTTNHVGIVDDPFCYFTGCHCQATYSTVFSDDVASFYPLSTSLLDYYIAYTLHTHSSQPIHLTMSPSTSVQLAGAVVPPGGAVEICTVSNTNAVVPPGGAVEICTVSNNDAVVPPGGAVEICTISKVVPPGGAVEICTIA